MHAQYPVEPQFFAQPAPAPYTVRQQYPAPPGLDFSQPIELRCILDPSRVMRRIVPLAIVTFLFVAFVAAMIIAIVASDLSPAAYYSAGAAIAVVAVWLMILGTKGRLTRVYRDKQRLLLTPHGMQRTDGTIFTDMPWSTISGIETRNAALPVGRSANPRLGNGATIIDRALEMSHTNIATGIRGAATISPLPGANRFQLTAHDRANGGGSNLSGGQIWITDRGLIFPNEFEENWVHGVVGAYLRHYRPDLPIPF